MNDLVISQILKPVLVDFFFFLSFLELYMFTS